MFDKAVNILSKINFEKEVDKVIKKNKNDILNFNRKNLTESELSTGAKITPEYAPSNKKSGNPDLRITGSFYLNQTLKANNGKVAFFNTDPNQAKVKSLEKRYGNDIHGIQQDDQDIVDGLIGNNLSLIIGKAFS